MADTNSAAFSFQNAAILTLQPKGIVMVEVYFIVQLARKPLQALARKWYCRGISHWTKGEYQCPECRASDE